MMRKTILLLMFFFVSAGCASKTNYANKIIDISDLEDRPSQIVSEYKIGIGDSIQINVWKNPDLGVTVPVRPDGKISAPLVGDVLVAGLTPEEVAEIITLRLAKFVRTPNVAVIMTELSSTTYISRVRVTGAVVQSTSLQHSQGMTILDAVLAAGGPNEFADTEKTQLFRRIDNETALIPINLNSILVEGNLSDNILLMPGDTLTIPERLF
jgi:polysaccharide export outer membrane protein